MNANRIEMVLPMIIAFPLLNRCKSVSNSGFGTKDEHPIHMHSDTSQASSRAVYPVKNDDQCD